MPPAIAFIYALVGRIIVLSSSTVDNNVEPTGRHGTTAVALPASQKIANGGTGLTIAKLRQAMMRFRRAKVNTRRTKLYIVVGGHDGQNDQSPPKR
jgi:hypothetical protein